MNQIQIRLKKFKIEVLRWIAFLTMLIWPEETAITFRDEKEEFSA